MGIESKFRPPSDSGYRARIWLEDRLGSAARGVFAAVDASDRVRDRLHEMGGVRGVVKHMGNTAVGVVAIMIAESALPKPETFASHEAIGRVTPQSTQNRSIVDQMISGLGGEFTGKQL